MPLSMEGGIFCFAIVSRLKKSLTTEAQRARRKKKVEVRRFFPCELP